MPVGRGLGAALLALSTLAGSAAAEDGSDWAIRNSSAAWSQGSYGAAWNGSCYGMMWARRVYIQLGLEEKRPFREVTAPSDTNTAAMALFASLAQSYALRNRDLAREIYALPTNPPQVETSLARGMAGRETPLLTLTNEKSAAGGPIRAHEVRIERREDAPAGDTNLVRYVVRDPNYPGEDRSIFYDRRARAFHAYDGYDTLRHDTSVLPEQNRRWLEALVRGATLPERERYFPVWRGSRDLPLTDAEYRRLYRTRRPRPAVEVPRPTEGLDRGASLMRSDGVGGVRLYFDPAVITDEGATEDGWRLLREVAERVTRGEESLLIRVGGERRLIAVRLRTVLRPSKGASRPTIGGLTRVLGYVLHRPSGEIYLLGLREPDAPAIPLDLLTSALRTIWRRGLTPAVSLDPNPADAYGPQKVRLVEIPAEDRKSVFVRVMLDADYAMKRIMLGEDVLPVPGYRSAYELIRDGMETRPAEYVRYWLSPRQTTGGDALITTSPGSECAVFDSNAQVQTETMTRAATFLVGTGTRSPLEERAARLFTTHYDRIAAVRPIFRELAGLFDVAKLAAVLRRQGVRNDLLDATAARAVAPVAIPESYAGIGPRVIRATGGLFCIGGGVQSAQRIDAADLARLSALARPEALRALVTERPERRELTVALPSSLPLDLRRARQVNAALETRLALTDLTEGAPERAVARLDRVLRAERGLAETRALRALCRLATGDRPGALADADLAARAAPALRIVRARARIYAGDPEGALADARAVAKAQPESPEILAQKAWVALYALQLAEAEKDLARLATIDPLDAELQAMQENLRLFRRLGPPRARRYIRTQLSLPFAVGLAMDRARQAAAANDAAAAIRHTEGALRWVAAHPRACPPAAQVPERCWSLLAELHYARGGEHRRSGAAYIERLRRRHPDWPSPLLMKVKNDRELPLPEVARLYRRAAAMRAPDDVLDMELQGRLGIDLRAYVGFLFVMRAAEDIHRGRGADPALVEGLAADVARYAPPGPTRALLSLIQDSVWAIARGRHNGEPSAAERKRFEAMKKRMASFPLEVPDPPRQGDWLTLMAVQRFFQTPGGELPVRPNGPPPEALFRKFTRMINSDWNCPPAIEQAAMTSLSFHLAFAHRIGRRIAARVEEEALTTRGEEGLPELVDTVARVDRMISEELVRLGEIPSFSRALLRRMLSDLYPHILRARDPEALAAEARGREHDALLALAKAPATRVELKAAQFWFDREIAALADAESDATTAHRMTQWHAARSRLRLRLAAAK